MMLAMTAARSGWVIGIKERSNCDWGNSSRACVCEALETWSIGEDTRELSLGACDIELEGSGVRLGDLL